MKKEIIICEICGNELKTIKKKNNCKRWFCDHCKKIVIGKSILIDL